MRLRGSSTGFVFRGGLDELIAEEAEFDVDDAEWSVKRANLPAEFLASNVVEADTEGGGFAEDRGGKPVGVCRLAKDCEQNTGAILLHLDRRREDIESTVGQESLGAGTDPLGWTIVEVGFDLRDGVGFGRCCLDLVGLG